MVFVTSPVDAIPSSTNRLPGAYTNNLIVHTLDDELNNDGDCSLREAITAANTNLPVDACPSGNAVLTDLITFDKDGIITLAEPLTITAGGPLELDGNSVITVSGANSVRVIYVDMDSYVNIKNITISNGYVPRGTGGGISNNGATVTLRNSVLINNRTLPLQPLYTCDGSAGGIFNGSGAVMTIIDSTVAENRACEGGGIKNHGEITLIRSTILRNDALVCSPLPGDCDGYAGGIYNSLNGVVTMLDSAVVDNAANYAGGIGNEGTVLLIRNTFSGNGLGILNTISGSAIMEDSFVVGNGGSGLVNIGTMTVTNSVFTGNRSFGSCRGGASGNGGGIANGGNLFLSDSLLRLNETDGMGGAIFNWGAMTVTRSIMTTNQVRSHTCWEGSGGGLANVGVLSLIDTMVSLNQSVGDAGGILNNGTMVLYNSTVVSNTADSGGSGLGTGGGVHNTGIMTLTGNTIADNYARQGGGVANVGGIDHPSRISLLNNTIAGNSAGINGGGILNELPWISQFSYFDILNSTVISNSALISGGGIYNGDASILTITRSIVGSSESEDCFGPIISLGYNIAGDASCDFSGPGDLNNTDPLLGPLANYGGPTRTFLPLEGSPAIDAGDNALCPTTDQRGFRRPGDGDDDGTEICDIGSVELYPWFVRLPIVFR